MMDPDTNDSVRVAGMFLGYERYLKDLGEDILRKENELIVGTKGQVMSSRMFNALQFWVNCIYESIKKNGRNIAFQKCLTKENLCKLNGYILDEHVYDYRNTDVFPACGSGLEYVDVDSLSLCMD